MVSKLIKLTSKVGKDNVFLAADEDREGEMIAWSLARELKLTKPKRIVFNSITAKELKNAIANTKLIDQHMVSAQQARRILDRFAGYLISPILRKNGFSQVLATTWRTLLLLLWVAGLTFMAQTATLVFACMLIQHLPSIVIYRLH